MRRREFVLGATCALAARPAAKTLGIIVYAQPDGLWLRRLPDGRAGKVAPSGKSPRFSPSGEWIAAGDFVVRNDGSQLTKLRAEQRAWVPRRDALAIVTPDGLALAEA